MFFTNGFSLILVFCIIPTFHHARSNDLSDILTASTDFLIKVLREEIDFTSTDILSEEWVENVDFIIEKYVQKIKKVHNLDQHDMHKRGIDEMTTITRDYQGVNVLSSIEELYDTSAKYPSDITLFYLLNNKGMQELYAAALESNERDPEVEMANDMVIYKFEIDRFKMLKRVPVMGGVDVESFSIKGIPYIVSAEYDAGTSGRPLEGSIVYRVGNKNLERVQILNTKYPMDIAVWEDLNEVYMAVATGQVSQHGKISYESDSLVYKWLGEHFDLITTLKTYNARCVTPFKIGSTMYLAVANHMNNYDETDIDSEIFKYNLHEDCFVSYQKIRTHAAMDIKFFSSGNKRKREHFIVVANLFEVGMDGSKIYETGSIIYKFADDYFVPFQSITLHAATQWLPITGPHGELVLIVACSSGIQTFQYDGWRFMKTEVQYSTATLGPGISSMRTFTLGGGSILAVANKRKYGDAPDLFNLKFKPTNDLQTFHSDMQKWCQDMCDNVDAKGLDELVEAIQKLPKVDDDIIYINEDLTIENARIHKLETNNMKIGEVSMNEDVIHELNNFADGIDKLQLELENIEASINNSMKVDGDNYIQGSIKFENITIICEECEIPDARISILNGENLDRFLRNTVNLMDGLVTSESLEFESLTVESFQIQPHFFNGHPTATLVGCSKDAHFTGRLELQGTTTLLGGLSVDGTVDGLTFSPKTLLLAEGDQSLDGSISLLWAQVENLDMIELNGMDANLLFQGAVRVHGDHTIQNRNTLSQVYADKVKINGLIYSTDLESLVESTLKVCGDQQVSGNWAFEKLSCDICITDGLISETSLLKDFVYINGLEYKINGEMEFTQPLVVDHLYVDKDFNGISVTDGKLDLLLLEPKETLYISGHKEFKNLHVSSQLKVSGTLNGVSISEWNSNKVIEDEVIIDGDVLIRGNVFINGSMKSEDLRDVDANFSVKKLLNHGVRMESSSLPGSFVTFLGTVEVENLYVDEINGINPRSWIIGNEESVQTISACKTFENGVLIVDPINLTGLINGIDLIELDRDVLKTYGDQVIEGTKSFNYIKAPSFRTEECLFGDYKCDDLMLKEEEQNVTGLNEFKQSVTVRNNLHIGNFTVEGQVGGYDLDYIIKDTLFQDGNEWHVKAPKTFKGKLRFDNVEVSGNISTLDMNGLLSMLYSKQYSVVEGSTYISQPTTIKNFYFTGWLDGIHHEEFGSSWLLGTGNQTVKGKQVFSKVTSKKNIALSSGKVNGWDLNELMNNAAMINEDLYLGSVTFDQVTSLKPVTLEGKLNNLNISTDIAFAEDGKDTKVYAEKVIKSDLIVDGNLIAKDMDYDINFEKMCELLIGDEKSHLNLLVEGNVKMVKEPTIVKSFNEYNLKSLYSDIWMSDRDVEISGHKDFYAMNFKGDIEVKGNIDGIDVKWLSENYLSKTKDQTIHGMVVFSGGVVFEKSLTAPKANVFGEVCGLKLDYFENRVLLDGPEQSFLGFPTFEEIITEGHLDVDGLVNGYDLDDILRWDRDLNILSGKIEVESIYAKELKLGAYASVQGVDIPLWSKLAVRTQDPKNIYSIKGTKTFTDAIFKDGISVEGKVDNVKFDRENIMLLSEEQTVTGKKTFNQGRADQYALFVKQLEVEGMLNDVDISDFLERLAYKNEDNVFTGQKEFIAPMSAEYVTVNGLYHGVNLSKVDLNEVPKAYEEIFSQFDYLFTVSDYFHKSLQRRAVYVSHYKSMQKFEKGIGLVLPISLNEYIEPDLAAISLENDNQAVMSIYEFNPEYGLIENDYMRVNLSNLVYIASLKCTGPYFLYVETSNEKELETLDEGGYYTYSKQRDYSTSGYFLHHVSMKEFRKSYRIDTNLTSTIAPIMLPHQKNCCYFLAQWHGNTSPILCIRGSLDYMVVFQKIPTYKVIEASVGSIDNFPYIAVLKESPKQLQERNFNIDIWKFSSTTNNFIPMQKISIEGARSVSSVEYRGISFLAVASGNVPGAIQTGFVKIYRVNPELELFVELVDLEVVLPWTVKFSVLPSNELVLYVSSESSAKPLVVFLYKGISGFKEFTHTSHAPIKSQIDVFTRGDWNNFVSVSGNGASQIFKPVFKGI